VYVNGDLTLNGFEPQTATDPLQLAPGDYHVDIRDLGAPADSTPVLQGDVTLKAGQNLSIIAGLTPAGDPQLNVFVNDLSAVPAGKARLVVRHVADAPRAVAELDGSVVINGISNGKERTKETAAGTKSLTITDAGLDLVEPTDVRLREGTATIVYLIGSQEQDTLALMVQTIDDLQSPVADVPTGDGGLLADPGLPLWAVMLMLGSVLAGAGAIRSLLGRKPTVPEA
jgi:Domain of unknown function (DUF4397)